MVKSQLYSLEFVKRSRSKAGFLNQRAAALAQSELDWGTECRLFQVAPPPVPISEDWPSEAWNSPWHMQSDERAIWLTQPTPFPDGDFALFGDGGFKGEGTATFACQARGFGVSPDYWGSAAWVSPQLSVRLPKRIGWEFSSIHHAELLSLVAVLRFRRPGQWHLLAFDRTSFFHVMEVASTGSVQEVLSSTGLPFVCLLPPISLSWARLGSPRRPSRLGACTKNTSPRSGTFVCRWMGHLVNFRAFAMTAPGW